MYTENMGITKIIHTSRPLFWLPHIFNYLFGAVASGNFQFDLIKLLPIVILTLPYSLFIYATNDFYDTVSDKANNRKGGIYGEKHNLGELKYLRKIAFWGFILSLLFFLFYGPLILAIFLFLSLLLYFYSTPPIRFKRIPVLDTLTGGFLYSFLIALLGFFIFKGSFQLLLTNFPPIILFVSILSIIAHLFGAVFDEKPDKLQKINTSAVFFGPKITLTFCNLLLILSFVLFKSNLIASAFIIVILSGCILGYKEKIMQSKFMYHLGHFLIYALFCYALLGSFLMPSILIF